MTNILWCWYYRLLTLKITIDAAFYYFITLHFILSFTNIVRSVFFIIAALILTPIEVLVVTFIKLCSLLDNNINAQLEFLLLSNNINKDSARKEFLKYRKVLYGE